MSPTVWMQSNLTTQGYCLSDAERRELWLAKVATAWLVIVGGLLAAGAAVVAVALGGLLVAACVTVTATNLCLPSETLASWERHTAREKVIAA